MFRQGTILLIWRTGIPDRPQWQKRTGFGHAKKNINGNNARPDIGLWANGCQSGCGWRYGLDQAGGNHADCADHTPNVQMSDAKHLYDLPILLAQKFRFESWFDL